MTFRWHRMYLLDEVGSTNDIVLDWVDREDKESGLVVIARSMRQGRGRAGHRWEAPPGGLWISMGWQGLSIDDALRLSLYAPLAVVHTLEAWGLSPRIRIPNDVFLDGKKLAGVLVERRGSATALGVGINVSNPLPPSLQDRATRLKDHLASPPNILSLAYQLMDKVYHLLIDHLHASETHEKWKTRLDTPRRFRGYVGEHLVEGELIDVPSPTVLKIRLSSGKEEILPTQLFHDIIWKE